jgi:hypothetical protein
MISLFKNIKNNLFAWKKIENKNFILQTIFDLSLLFKSFLHWNFSKIALYMWWIILALILSLPFFIIYNILWGMSFVEIYASLFSWISINVFDWFLVNIIYLYKSLWYILLLAFTFDYINIIYLIWGILFLISFFYPNLIFIKLYNWYLKWDKYLLKELDILNVRKYIKFLNLTFINLFILLIPVVIFFILVWILALFSWNLEQLNTLVASWSNNYFSVISFILLILCIFILIYLIFRIIFSYFVLALEYEKSRSVFSYIKEWFKKSRGFKKFLKLLWLFVLFTVVIIPLKYIWFIISLNWTVVNIFTIIFSLFVFIFIYGLFLMIMTSFYKRELK